MSESFSMTLSHTISDHITFFTFFFDFPKISEKHLSASTVEYWEKYREHLKSILSSKFKTVTWHKFV